MEQKKACSGNSFDLINLPKDSHEAIKFIVDVLINNIYPLLKGISDTLHLGLEDELSDEYVIQVRNVYTLCADQIKKTILSFLQIVKLEYQDDVYLQESRQCAEERLSWCFQKLISIEQLLNRALENDVDASNESLLMSSMYFVNWIDQTFDVLHKLSNIIYNTNCKETSNSYSEWKKELVECICGLHTSIDELLLSAMTLCKYCLSADQVVVKARCQVVLRETKSLLKDLIDGDLDTVQPTVDTLKLPIMPSNVNVLIDVLKDVLYVLETNTNTALLTLVVHCFSQSISPVDRLRNHFANTCKGACSCCNNGEDATEKCIFIRDFDLHNERLLQIGSFAMSCSSDQKRILCLRSGLASLEALDPHLVPAVMVSAGSCHSAMLVDSWNQEVMQIRDSVFLIVDPAAFADKARQMMHQTLLEITRENYYDNSKTCAVINIGCVVYDFFHVYEKLEPDALTYQEQLTPLLRDLKKAQTECKIVSNILSVKGDHLYDVKKPQNNSNATNEQMIKRLKLLYTLVKRVNNLINPKENEDEFYDEPVENKNITQTINLKNANTYVMSPRKLTNNMTRSIFARTNIRSSTGKFPLAILTKHLKTRNPKDLSFSLKLDEMCNISDIEIKSREKSILYSPLKTRSSLRKAVLSKNCVLPVDINSTSKKIDLEHKSIFEKESLMDDTTSLQITDVLNQINDLTIDMSTRLPFNSTVLLDKSNDNLLRSSKKHVLKLPVNNDTTFRHTWNISVNSSARDNETNTSNITQPSDVNTLERINDLDLVESRLISLRSGQIETSL